MTKFFTILTHDVVVKDIDKYWYIKKILSVFRLKRYRRLLYYVMMCQVNNNQKLYIGDRFIAGEYYPPVIFQVIKKLGKKTIVARSAVASTMTNPTFTGKCIIITKH